MTSNTSILSAKLCTVSVREAKNLTSFFNVQFGQQTSVDVAMGNRHPNPQSEPEDGGPGAESRQGRSRLRSEGAGQQEEGEEPELEVPPPMRPISSIPAAEEVKKVNLSSLKCTNNFF
jgi:hypothetical protein